jgi:hypothetical protein
MAHVAEFRGFRLPENMIQLALLALQKANRAAQIETGARIYVGES